MKRLIYAFVLSAILVNAIILAPVSQNKTTAVSASAWKAGRIIDDGIFVDKTSMSIAEIQTFLDQRVGTGGYDSVPGYCDTTGSRTAQPNSNLTRAQYSASLGKPTTFTCLNNYYEVPKTAPGPGIPANNYGGLPIPAGAKSAAELIWNAAQLHGISPRVLLVTIQKESAGPLTTDDWPFLKQYTYAMGAYCPDSGPGGSANCNENYAGFSIQISESASLMRWYLDNMNQPWWTHKKPGNNAIQYNPNVGCGAQNVYIENMATAALYTYTPYQPNTAALNNMYGTGDGCSAYGNRNFWRIYNDWFGSTIGSLNLIKSSSDPTVFVLYAGKKQGIPSPDVLSAWGLEKLPISILDSTSVNAIPTLGPLTRLAKNPYNNNLYLFADAGGTYDTLSNMAVNWGQSPSGASTIGPELIAYTGRRGGLSAFVTSPTAGGIYTMDGGKLRMFSTADRLQSWAGNANVNNVSSGLLGQFTAGSGIFTTQAQTTSSQYQFSQGKLMYLNSDLAQQYPRDTVTTISSALADVLPGGTASRFVRANSGAIFLMDRSKKLGITSLGLLDSYMGDTSGAINTLSDSELATIPNGQLITTRFAYNSLDSTKQYYINHGIHSVPADFAVNTYGVGLSAASIALTGSNKGNISCTQGLIQPRGFAGIYSIDNGTKRGIGSLDMLSMLKNDAGNICVLDPEDVSAVPLASPISVFVSNGGINYMLEQNSRYSITSPVAAFAGITGFTPVSTTFLAHYIDRGALTQLVRSDNNYVYLSNAGYYVTTNQTIAKLWTITDTSQQHNGLFVRFIRNNGALTQFARSIDPTNGAIYITDAGKFLPIAALDHLFNAGLTNQSIPQIEQTTIAANIASSWQGYLAKDNSTNIVYVLEGGFKHVVPTGIQSNWLGTSAPIVPTGLSSEYLSLLPNGSAITKSIESIAPGIYGIIDGKKAGIPNLATFNALYAPATRVSDRLIRSVPNGPPIPSN